MTESTTSQWVADLKAAYPHLPDHLSIDLEKEGLQRLDRWFSHVRDLREAYDEMDRSDLPEELRDEPGKRQIIPVLLSLEAMTDDEREAWHELFVCLSAMMADLAYKYWQTHSGYQNTVSLEDTLNYLPVVFLYVLSSYNPYPSTQEHDEDFSHSDQGRVRLSTWVRIDARRHINTYLQHHAYTVKKGSGYLHRLRRHILRIQNENYSSTGEMPSEEELVTNLSSTHYGSLVTTSTLSGHVRSLLAEEPPVSLSDPIGATDGNLTYEDTITSTANEVDSYLDLYNYMESRTENVPALREAVRKLLHTSEPLSFMELFYLG